VSQETLGRGNDATWIADLLAHGLIRASFIPEQDIQDLRSLMRARKQMTRQQISHVQRVQKTLEEANIKLDSVITDIMGATGRRMIEAMIAGEANPIKLAQLADCRIKSPRDQLTEALRGRLREHHRFLLQLYLGQYDSLSAAIATIDREVASLIARMDETVESGQATTAALIALLCTIPASASWRLKRPSPRSGAI
jgi:prefoldin subunit 5